MALWIVKVADPWAGLLGSLMAVPGATAASGSLASLGLNDARLLL